jgi:predicted transcriptional regulator
MPQRTVAMTRTEYRQALRSLSMTPYKVAKYLGVSRRQAHRYASGETGVPGPVAMVLRELVKNGRLNKQEATG